MTKFCEAAEIVRATTSEFPPQLPAIRREAATLPCMNALPMDDLLLLIVRKYGDKIILKESDRKPKMSKKKGKRKSSQGLVHKESCIETVDSWQGPPPWNMSLGGDGCPKFLCDVMVSAGIWLCKVGGWRWCYLLYWQPYYFIWNHGIWVAFTCSCFLDLLIFSRLECFLFSLESSKIMTQFVFQIDLMLGVLEYLHIWEC